MKKNDLQISIPTPCHENWDAMTPTEIGKFCSSCQKEVIDFSRMSDQEIRRILNSSKETPCGRFNTNQIERPLVAEVPVNRSLTWIKYAASLFLAFQGTNAISQTTNTTISPKDDLKTPNDSIKTIEISGYVYDSISREGIFNCKILIKLNSESIYVLKSDLNGYFKLDVQLSKPLDNYDLIFQNRFDGYETTGIKLIDFIKTNKIFISKLGNQNSLINSQGETELGVVGNLKILKPKKKWYQFWKK